jgi:hypothetical protein
VTVPGPAASIPSYYGKHTDTLTPAQLQEYDALAYEVEMLHEIAVWARQGAPSRPQIVENVLAESFALHFRNLASFLWSKSKRRYPTDVLARDFVSDLSWPPRAKPPDIQPFVDRASREVGHLTTERRSDKTEDKRWPVTTCIRLLLPALVDFAERADPARRPPRLSKEIENLRKLVGLPGEPCVLPDSIDLSVPPDSIDLTTQPTRPLLIIEE